MLAVPLPPKGLLLFPLVLLLRRRVGLCHGRRPWAPCSHEPVCGRVEEERRDDAEAHRGQVQRAFGHGEPDLEKVARGGQERDHDQDRRHGHQE